MARQSILGGLFPTFLNEGSTRQSILSGVFINESAGGAFNFAGDSGSYAISGQAAAFLAPIVAVGVAGAYAISGNAAMFASSGDINATGATGAYSITGYPGTFLAPMFGAAGAYVITGQNARFQYTGQRGGGGRAGLGFGLGRFGGSAIRPFSASKAQAALYTGQVATRSGVSRSLDLTNLQFNSRSWHFARDDLASFQIGFWNGAVSGLVEVGAGGSGVLFAAIEYPVGTFTRVTWNGGAASVTIADNAVATSDSINLAIPNAAKFYVRFFYSGSVSAPHTTGFADLGGDLCQVAVSGLSDLTMGGTITNNGAFLCAPCFIVGQTRQPSIAILGDSIGEGQGDTTGDGTGAVGSISRSIASLYGYCNMAIVGDALNQFVASHSVRASIAQLYCSSVIIQYGRNDFFNGHRSSAQFLANLASTIALFSGKTIVTTTIFPSSTSSDSWATTGNQETTNGADDNSRKAANAAIRAGIAGAAHFAEIADVVESARDSGVWKAPGYTADGVHGTNAAYLAIRNAAVIDAGWFAR